MSIILLNQWILCENMCEIDVIWVVLCDFESIFVPKSMEYMEINDEFMV